MKGDVEVLKTIIAAKADVNKQDWDDYAALHYCAQNGFITGAQALLDDGAKINIQTRLKETPLVIAIKNNKTEMVDFLLQTHADVSKSALKHQTPLFFVSDEAITELLIKANADVNARDDTKMTPLHKAAKEGYLDVAKLLVKNGADVNAVDNQKQTPLHVAAGHGQVKVCKFLLESGADFKALDNTRRSPEMLARRNDHLNVTALIASFHEHADDDDAPPIGFKAFTGIKYSAEPPPGTDPTLTLDDLKFDILGD
jgi:ankyrin repeat protein